MSETAYIEFRTHAVTVIRTDDGTINCLKFAGSIGRPRCSYESFLSEAEATEWIVQPFPVDWYELRIQ